MKNDSLIGLHAFQPIIEVFRHIIVVSLSVLSCEVDNERRQSTAKVLLLKI
jgi:hypothetical protein